MSAVAFTIYTVGFGPALLSTAVGYLTCNLLFVTPSRQFNLVGLIAYLISCAAIIGLGEAMRRARFRAQGLAEELRQEVNKKQQAESKIHGEIQERKLHELELRDLSQQLKIVTDSMSIPVTRCSRDLRYLWVSKSYADWMGRKADELVGRPIVEILGAAAFDHLLPYFERLLSGEVVRYEKEVEFPGIGRRWVTAVYTPTFDHEEKCDGWVAVVNDINDRNRMEMELRESELRFHTMADSVPVHIWVNDDQGKRLFVNARYLEYTGVAPERPLGRGWIDMIHPDDQQLYFQQYRSAVASRGAFRAELRLRRHDGIYKWFQVVGMPRFHGEHIAGYVGINIDVTDRKSAEQRSSDDLEAMTRLQEIANLCAGRDADFQQCLDGIVDAAIAFTAAQKGTLQLFDDKFGTLKLIAQKGFDEPFRRFFESVDGQDASLCAEVIRTHGRVIVEDVLESAILAGQPSLGVLLQAGVRAIQSTPLISGGGSLIGIISTHFSLSRRPDDRQLRLMDLLARKAADYIERQRAEEILREYAQQLAEADRRKGDFLATLAHELRNPLAPISNAVQMMREIEGSDPNLLESRELIDRQVQQMVRLIDDLLDISRITRNKLELRKNHIALQSVIENAIETSRSQIEEASHQLSVSVPTDSVYIDGDSVRLAQAFSNLLNNAANSPVKAARFG